MIMLIIGTISYATAAANDIQPYYKCQEEVKGKKVKMYVHLYDLNEYKKALTAAEGHTATCSDKPVQLTHRGSKIMQQREKIIND